MSEPVVNGPLRENSKHDDRDSESHNGIFRVSIRIRQGQEQEQEHYSQDREHKSKELDITKARYTKTFVARFM